MAEGEDAAEGISQDRDVVERFASHNSKSFYRCATRRFDEAVVLFRSGYFSGSIYLAGYTVECILKALILDATPSRRRENVLQSFRGTRGHSYDFLRLAYIRAGGARLPASVVKLFTLVAGWSTELRYLPAESSEADAKDFLAAVEGIMLWARQRR